MTTYYSYITMKRYRRLLEALGEEVVNDE